MENPENFGGQNWLLRLAARHVILWFVGSKFNFPCFKFIMVTLSVFSTNKVNF